jgi:hypothetical protein
MEIIKRIVDLSSLKNYETPLIYEFLSKELKVKGCLDVNTKQIILQNAEDFDQNWGKIMSPYIYLNFFLTQSYDDMGIFTDVDYTDQPVSYQLLFDKYSAFTTPISAFLLFSSASTDPSIRYFARFSGFTAANFYSSGGTISGLTDPKLYTVTSYSSATPFIIGLNFSDDPGYYTGVNNIFANSTAYTINALSGSIFTTGIQYRTFDFNRLVYNSLIDQYFSIPYTTFKYKSEGWNQSNTSLSALTKQEVYFGIVFPPKVDNNVFIERGNVSVFESQSRLGTILSMSILELNGNGYYNIIK